MNEKELKHSQKMQQLKKHFKRLKLTAIILWLIANVIIDTIAILFFSVEIVVFAIIIVFILSTMFMIKYLNNIDKIRIAQETQLMEETPLGRLKI